MLKFEWNDTKAQSNLSKHGVSFDTAKSVFEDPNGLIDIDDSELTEERWRIIGMSREGIMFVVFTEPEGNVIRIISVRKANRNEQNRYVRQPST